MADPSVEAMDVRIEIERAVAPLLDLVRENTALLRTVLEQLHDLQLEPHAAQ
jgi:hypothetical protein